MDNPQFNYHIKNESDQHRPWLVLINGLFASLESWNEVVENLSKNFRVLRYDGPGQGLGPKLEGTYSLEQLTLYLKELLDHLQIKEACFVGLSNGGRIALNFASLYPQRVSALVAADTYSRPSELLKRKLNSWLQANRIGGATHRFDVATPWIWGESVVSQRPELLDFYRERAALAEDAVVEGLILGAMEDKAIDLNLVTCPVLLLAGKEDVLTPSFIHEEMGRYLAQGEFKEVAGGHASLLEYPDTVEDVVAPWLVCQTHLKEVKRA